MTQRPSHETEVMNSLRQIADLCDFLPLLGGMSALLKSSKGARLCRPILQVPARLWPDLPHDPGTSPAFRIEAGRRYAVKTFEGMDLLTVFEDAPPDGVMP